jgi:UDP-3-O-[3-hydroxymyristoyl] N-acetylglucosamine deacetylase
MDGLPTRILLEACQTAQQTLKAPIDCVGVGLHSGRKTSLALLPAPIGTGIVFRRADLGGASIPARFDHVEDTRLCTVLGLPYQPAVRVATVEHVMAALAGCGVTNAVVEVDGPEVPILDGSSASFVFLIDCAGMLPQTAPAPVIEVLRTVRVTQGEGDNFAFAELRPSPYALDMALSIDFDAAAIGRQALSMRVTPESFRAELARARTFAQANEVAALQAGGLALGGSLENAVVVDNARVLNPAGLRMADEFVRHKMLDAVGDLALAGATLRGRLVAHRGGHALNNMLLRTLFADDANWRLVQGPAAPAAAEEIRIDGAAGLPGLGAWPERRLPVAAAPA